MLRRAAQILFWLSQVGFAVLALYFIFQGGVQRADSPPIAYGDFIAILLTALAVMMAVAAFFVAILAVWGYKEAHTLVTQTAREAAESAALAELPRLLTPERLAAALKSDLSVLMSAIRESKETLFGNVDSSEADDIVEALDIDGDERP